MKKLGEGVPQPCVFYVEHPFLGKVAVIGTAEV